MHRAVYRWHGMSGLWGRRELVLVKEEPQEVTFHALRVVISSYHSLRKALG